MLGRDAAQGQLKCVNSSLLASPSQPHTETDEARARAYATVAKIDAIQAEYSAFETLHETDGLIEAARELGVTYVAYSPLGHGWLVDDFPYKTPEDFAPDDFRRSCEYTFLSSSGPPHPSSTSKTTNLFSPSAAPKFQGANFHANAAIRSEISALAQRKQCSLAQVALAWVAAQGMIAIPGTTKAARLESNWASREVDLTEDEKAEMRRIVDAAKPQGERYGEANRALVGH